MRKILYIIPLLLAFTFTGNPPGWYQQTLPVNDFVNDIFFIDTLTGWVVTDGHAANNDTAYIMKTTNGGDNWTIQFARNLRLNVVQFLDAQTGYVGGGLPGAIYMYKTTNGGDTWFEIISSTSTGTEIDDMYFLDPNTGWICDDASLDGGLYKTTNGGLNWAQQMNNSYHIQRLYFLNKDTGWAGSNDAHSILYRTTNGGVNWNAQFTFISASINDIYFFNHSTGIITSGLNRRTTDGGFTWMTSNDGGIGISMISDSIGWAGLGFNQVTKTTNGGVNWYSQFCPIFSCFSISAIDSQHSWGGGSGIVKTTDGGGPTNIFQINNTLPNVFDLYQNYPNPFNPTTSIKFKVKNLTNIKLNIFDITGREISVLVNEKLQPGEYNYLFDGSMLTSGIYFYKLTANGNIVDTKKMVLIK